MKKRERNSFLTPLIVEVMPSGKTFKVAREFTYLWKRKYIEVHIPVGTLTDFASIPRLARLVIPKLGKHTKATVPHDAIYRDEIPGHVFTRSEADLMFLDGMRDLGVVKWKRTLMYWAVRVGGYFAWQKRTPCGF